MKINQKNEVVFLTFDQWEDRAKLVAVHSTRIGGVSENGFTSMNLGFARGDNQDRVHENYRRFSEGIEVPLEKLVLSDQWHHNEILEVEASHEGMGIFKTRNYHDVDGLFTTLKELPLVTFYADCVPIYFYDPVLEAIGMAHAGWRGTASQIVLDMLRLFQKKGSQIENIEVSIGPAVCQKCYQVDQKVIDAMDFNFAIDHIITYSEEEDRYYIDLKNINKEILVHAGVLKDKIEVTHHCTACEEELFFSHRRQGNHRGTQIGVMMIRE
ncbi:MAG: peptidoglycan editing factor PgeF [Clostridia bacterium]|nr:peptidoglycan editing factor PgeF [Clostridia bacterium]